MKIAIMAAWNTSSGVAMHAEPLGKAFIEMGYDVTVFSYVKNDYHGEGITAEDEPYVIRCFGTRKNTNYFDPRPFMEKDYDILLVEDLGMLPVDKLADMMSIIRKKAKIVHVVHENRPFEESWFCKIDWDKVIYFDHRQEFLKIPYPDAVFIPFPCYKLRSGDKIAARKKLGLPLDKNIVCSFAHRNYIPYLLSLPKSLRENTVLLQVIQDDYEMLEEFDPSGWMIVRREKVVTTQKFDEYLFASDAAIFHKFQTREHAVVSTTVYQALGTGCPIFVPKYSDFFHTFTDEMVHYNDVVDLHKKLKDTLENEKKRKALQSKAEKFIQNRSAEKIAGQYIDIFKELLTSSTKK
ncbi:MAG: hypothetical protein KKH98_11840 [Spirochaetes bacterium]|nr:hypothetical protein [Spirochaetota bacterium]